MAYKPSISGQTHLQILQKFHPAMMIPIDSVIKKHDDHVPDHFSVLNILNHQPEEG